VRFTATVLLWLLTTAALVVAVPAAWTQKNIIDPGGYAAIAEKAANDPALRAAVASELATRATALIKQRGYSADSAEVHAVAAAYTASPSFPPHFADANRLVHSWMFAGTGAQSEEWPRAVSGSTGSRPSRKGYDSIAVPGGSWYFLRKEPSPIGGRIISGVSESASTS
jgi:hypothetical protein